MKGGTGNGKDSKNLNITESYKALDVIIAYVLKVDGTYKKILLIDTLYGIRYTT